MTVGKHPEASQRLLHVLFEEQAARTPGRVAVRDPDGSTTYAALSADSARIASALRARGIGAGSAVGLHLDRSVAYVSALLGILKAQAAVVPLPPAYPPARLREILDFARLDAVVDAASLAELRSADVVSLAVAPEDPERIAFVLCSSGSTGRPKMIARSHRSFFHRLEWTWNEWPYADDEACEQKSHMTTTHAIYELFEPLLRGVGVHVIPDETVRDLEKFWDLVRETHVTRLLVVPSMLQVSLDLPGFVAPPLRQVVLMGEYLQSRLAGQAISAFPATTALFSIYGSTEASSTLVCDLRKSWREGRELPLGRPIAPDVRPLVLDPDLEPVAPGESGLLYMSGPALFEGYFRNPELTAAAFATSRDGDRLFNTQDQVRRTPDGEIEFVGRVDHTVKVRGFRVDLGEVERALLLQPGIRQAAVMLDGPASENPALVAFYAPAVERNDVLVRLKEQLPPYMVPSAFVPSDSLPLTASGKLDRMRLLEDYRQRPRPLAPTGKLTPTEARVLRAWREVLKHAEPGPDSNFFEIGGTSLSVFSVVSALRTEFGLGRGQLTDHSIYEFPTPRLLAAELDGVMTGRHEASSGKPSVAVTLRQGSPDRAPLFVIASSGGTLGAYDLLSKTLDTDRAIVGIRDPFVWGGREPAMSFADWISIYVAAILERQPQGPYYVCAFSSAGAFGYEVAQRLRSAGHEVAELILIDPVGIAGELPGDFGHRAFRSMFVARRRKLLTRVAGWWRHVSGRGRREGARPGGNGFVMTAAEFARREAAVRRDKSFIKDLSSLFELNSGLPFALSEADFEGRSPDEYTGVLLAKVREVAPDVDPETVERILVQYYALQIPTTHFYSLRNYDGRVSLFEPQGPHVGLFAAYFRPHLRDLYLRTLPIGVASERVEFACRNLSRSLRAHYRSMRDETFVRRLAAEMAPRLR
jgi:amino acid adenylation domain-containing protein